MAPSSPLVVKMVGMERRQLSWQRGIPNRLIKEADKVSSRILKEYADGRRVHDLRIVPGHPCLTYAIHWLNTSAEAVQHQDPAAGANDAG
jgi:hypothetical protein